MNWLKQDSLKEGVQNLLRQLLKQVEVLLLCEKEFTDTRVIELLLRAEQRDLPQIRKGISDMLKAVRKVGIRCESIQRRLDLLRKTVVIPLFGPDQEQQIVELIDAISPVPDYREQNLTTQWEQQIFSQVQKAQIKPLRQQLSLKMRAVNSVIDRCLKGR